MAGSKPAALPLGDTPTHSLPKPVVVPPSSRTNRSSRPELPLELQTRSERRLVEAVRNPSPPLAWLVREHRGRMRRINHRREDTGAGARESCGPVATEPVECVSDDRVRDAGPRVRNRSDRRSAGSRQL